MRQGLLFAAITMVGVFSLGTPVARAYSPLGLYVGGDIGHSGLSAGTDLDSVPFGFRSHPTGWDAFVGVHPLPGLGFEADYIDFGSGTVAERVPATARSSGYSVAAHASIHATALYTLLYLPLPVPQFDVFAKAGAAHLTSNLSATGSFTTCSFGLACTTSTLSPGTLDRAFSDWRFAYGVGAQFRFSQLGVGVEYQRISLPGGDPTLLGLRVSWLF